MLRESGGRQALWRSIDVIAALDVRENGRMSFDRTLDESALFRICFVCTGNICRSPMAETVFRALVKRAGYEGAITVISAGTGDWHVGEPSDTRTTSALSAHGYDGSRHRAKQFDPEWFDNLDLVVVFDRSQERILRAWANTEQDRGKVQMLLSFDSEQAAQVDVPDRGSHDDRKGQRGTVPPNRTRNPTGTLMTPLPEQPLSPLDGRYRAAVTGLGEHLSEAGLNRARIHVEVEWLIYLTDRELFGSHRLDAEQARSLRALVADFGQDDIDELGVLEATTRHDVKAVEYYVRARLVELGLTDVAELTHFACTSEDINNLSYALTIRAAVHEVWLPKISGVIDTLYSRAVDHRADAMLAHTHGQPATPTTVGKEFAVFVGRLRRILGQIEAVEYLGKFSGATGPSPPTSPRTRARTGRRSPASSSPLSASTGIRSPPRSSRTTGRPSSTNASAMPIGCCTTCAPTSGRTSPWATSPRYRRPGPLGHPRCRTRSTRSASRTPRPTSNCRAPSSTRSRRPS